MKDVKGRIRVSVTEEELSSGDLSGAVTEIIC